MPRLVIVEPAYASTVGHHGEVNRPLLKALGRAGWQTELWADVALEAEVTAPRPLRGVFSGCGYEDPRHWRELGGMLLLAKRMEQQLEQASGSSVALTPDAAQGGPVAAWLGHSLLPFQLLGLARHLNRTAAARVLISLMFAPGETLEAQSSSASGRQAAANARVALAALARACSQQGHRLTLAFPSGQHEALYAPLLAATGLSSAGVHPAVVGAGSRPEAPLPGAAPLVLLHWGDCKQSKGRSEALAVLEGLLEQAMPEPLQGWGWLFHQHSAETLPEPERLLLERLEASGLGLVRLQGEVESAAMSRWLARCPLALLAYDPVVYGQRSSGLFWQWAASRQALGLPAVAVGHGQGWLAAEAQALRLPWVAACGGAAGWLAGLAQGAALAARPAPLSAYGRQLFDEGFAIWCVRHLAD